MLKEIPAESARGIFVSGLEFIKFGVNGIWIKIMQQARQLLAGLTHLTRFPAIKIGVWQPLAIALAITVISFLAVDVFYKIVSFPLSIRPADARILRAGGAALPDASPDSNRQIAVIVERNLFQTTPNALADKPDGGALPSGDEHTSFDLKGTVAADNSTGFIIVEERGKKIQKLFRLGDKIGSAKLIGITRNSAVLRSGGEDIVLRIKETPGDSLSAFLLRPEAGAKPPGSAISTQEVIESLGDLQSITGQAILTPSFDAGVREGYTISNIAQNSLYQKMGLQNGDVIIDVNGEPFRSGDNLLQFVTAMQSEGKVSIRVKRNARDETISYSFQ